MDLVMLEQWPFDSSNIASALSWISAHVLAPRPNVDSRWSAYGALSASSNWSPAMGLAVDDTFKPVYIQQCWWYFLCDFLMKQEVFRSATLRWDTILHPMLHPYLVSYVSTHGTKVGPSSVPNGASLLATLLPQNFFFPRRSWHCTPKIFLMQTCFNRSFSKIRKLAMPIPRFSAETGSLLVFSWGLCGLSGFLFLGFFGLGTVLLDMNGCLFVVLNHLGQTLIGQQNLFIGLTRSDKSFHWISLSLDQIKMWAGIVHHGFHHRWRP